MLPKSKLVQLFCTTVILIQSPQLLADRIQQPAIEHAKVEQALLLAQAAQNERRIAVGEQGVILTSNNAGASWQQALVPSSVLLTTVKFSDDSTAWAAGHDGVVLKSVDGGTSWRTVLTGADILALNIESLEHAITVETDDFVREELGYKLEDAELALEEGPSSPVLDLLFITPQHGFLIGAYGMMLETQNGGENWQHRGFSLPNPDGLHLNRIYQQTSGRLVLLGEAGLLLASDDDGANWYELDSPYQGSFFAAAETDSLYIFGLRGNAFRFDENNQEWQTIDLPTEATISDATVANNELILVGQGGVVLKQDGDDFHQVGNRELRSFSSVSLAGDYLIVTGEAGVERIALTKNQIAAGEL